MILEVKTDPIWKQSNLTFAWQKSDHPTTIPHCLDRSGGEIKENVREVEGKLGHISKERRAFRRGIFKKLLIVSQDPESRNLPKFCMPDMPFFCLMLVLALGTGE